MSSARWVWIPKLNVEGGPRPRHGLPIAGFACAGESHHPRSWSRVDRSGQERPGVCVSAWARGRERAHAIHTRQAPCDLAVLLAASRRELAK